MKNRVFIAFLLSVIMKGASAQPARYNLEARMIEIRDLFIERFVHPETSMIMDFYDPPNTFYSKNLPTAEEIRSCIPNPTGWKTGMENSTMDMGVMLPGLVYAAEASKDPADVEFARRIFNGCVLVATVGEPGFVARHVMPDMKTYYPNSSVDQYTMFTYGVWGYYHSDFATEKEKELIRKIMNDIASKIVRDGYTITRDDGNPNVWVSDLESIKPDRSSRLLMILLAA